jgi:hypothetical protein
MNIDCPTAIASGTIQAKSVFGSNENSRHGAPYGKVECHLLQCVSQPIAEDAPHCYTMGIFEIGKLLSLGCVYIAGWFDGLPFHPRDRT